MNASEGAGPGTLLGIRLFGLACLLLGLLASLGLGYWLPEFGPGFFRLEGTSRGDLASRCLALATLSGFVAGVLVVATGVVLFSTRERPFTTTVRLMSSAAGASLAMAVIALAGGLLGDSKGGFTEATLIGLGLPIGLILFLLSGCGVWFLRRPDVRQELS